MRLAHLSDLHFGTEDKQVVNTLLETLKALELDFIVISGDFTQIANKEEFQISKDFIDNLPCPFLSVPGNHDIPRFHLKERLFNPYKKYKNFITPDLSPVFENEKVLIAGLNSARRALPHWNWANGAISKQQRVRIAEIFKPNELRWTICTFHHPIHKVDEMPLDVTVFGRKRALKVIKNQRIDLVLTGHVHHASLTTIGDEEHQTIYLSASTALSSRTRGQENGFNVITLNENVMAIEIYKLGKQGFECVQNYEINKSDDI